MQDPLEFYQGARTVADLIESIEDYIIRARSTLSRECLDVISRLGNTEHLASHEFIDAVRTLQRYVDLFNMANIS